MKKLNIKGWIKPKWKRNIKVKVKCVMRNEWIDGLATNHSPALIPKQERMQVLDAKELESSSNMDLRDVLWWMSIKNACRLGVPLIARL